MFFQFFDRCTGKYGEKEFCFSFELGPFSFELCRRQFLLPAIVAPVMQIDEVHLPTVIDKAVDQKTDNADNQRAENGCPEPLDIEARYQGRGHLEHGGIDNECKQAQAQDVDGQRDDQSQRAEKGIQDTQHGRGPQSGQNAADTNAVQEKSGQTDGDAQYNPPNQKSAHALVLLRFECIIPKA